jgi:hypothetical protein
MGQLLVRVIQHARFTTLLSVQALPVAVIESALVAAAMALVGSAHAVAPRRRAARRAAVQPPAVTRPADREQLLTTTASYRVKLDQTPTARA